MSCLNSLSSEEIIILGTSIALELIKGKSKEEIKQIKSLIAQVLCTVSNCLY